MTRVYHCNRCKISERIEDDENIVRCKHCRDTFIQIYSNNKDNNLKGGENQMATKSKSIKAKKKPKAEPKEKVAKEPKAPGVSKVRAENAQKVKDFMGTLGITDLAEMRKTLSNCYNHIAKEQKKK
jgi:hypothetical protein